MVRRLTIEILLENARLALEAGRLREANKAINEVLARDADNACGHELAGLAQLRQGDPGAAVTALQRAIEIADGPHLRTSLALALIAAGAPDRAESELRTALEGDPSFVPGRILLGDVLLKAGRHDAARDQYVSALAAEPGSLPALVGLAGVARATGNCGEAIARLRAATEIDAANADVWAELGDLALEVGNSELAIRSFNSALSHQPANTRFFARLCDAYARRDGETDSGGNALRRLSGPALETIYDVLAVLLKGGFIDAVMAGFEEVARRNPEQVRAGSQLAFLSNYTEVSDPTKVVDRAKQVGKVFPRDGLPPRWWPEGDDADRPLRVGLVSDDLRDHVVRYFLLSFLEHVDQTKIQLFAYSSTQVHDAVTAQYQRIIRQWHDAQSTSDTDLAARIAADRIDILIDLGGHTQRTRLGVFARRRAPVQLTWLGYSGTSGLAEMDYILGDRFVTPAADKVQYTETPWHMPDAYLCYRPDPIDIAVQPPPCVEARRITFGSLNLLAKVSDATIALWSEVLAAVPRSRLLLKASALDDPRHAAAITDSFGKRGVAADRLILAGNVPDRVAHFKTYNRIDVALDPLPYNGTTTTAEALWMGVPVLTLRGDRFIARVGECLVTTAGHPEWVAGDNDDFVRKAAALAGDRKRLAARRRQLRAELLASPLCDGPRFARNFEAALRAMWRHRCDNARTAVPR